MKAAYGGEVTAALLLDAFFGELPEALHPTVWMGRSISALEKRALRLESPLAWRLAGIALALSLPSAAFLSARVVLRSTPRRLRWAMEAFLISTTVSMRGLAEAASVVEKELAAGDMTRARSRVGEFVGRDTVTLSAAGVSRAAVESVAENTSDGVVAPMLYGLCFGAPGALAYRAVNTLDSMLGHKREPYTHLGWASARLDDLANLAPSRLTVLAAAIVSGCAAKTLETARRYGPLTASPNAGWTEAAFAGALGLRLGGPNTYGGEVRQGPVLGNGRPPAPGDIDRSVRLMRRSCILLAMLALLVGVAGRG